MYKVFREYEATVCIFRIKILVNIPVAIYVNQKSKLNFLQKKNNDMEVETKILIFVCCTLDVK